MNTRQPYGRPRIDHTPTPFVETIAQENERLKVPILHHRWLDTGWHRMTRITLKKRKTLRPSAKRLVQTPNRVHPKQENCLCRFFFLEVSLGCDYRVSILLSGGSMDLPLGYPPDGPMAYLTINLVDTPKCRIFIPNHADEFIPNGLAICKST